jgi:hypothetical protein
MSTPLTLETLERHRGSNIKSRIRRVGIEVEGAWDVLVPGYRGLNIIRDGSVRFVDGQHGFDAAKMVMGEIASPPVGLDDWEETLKRIYPQAVNATCGLHVHVSMSSALQYQRLMDPRLLDYLELGLNAWGMKENLPLDHELFKRLSGANDACQKRYMANEQARVGEKRFDRHAQVHRYTFINYCYSRHETIECRVLPMFSTVEQSASAIKELFHIYNSFIVATAEQEERVAGDFFIPEIGEADQVSSIVRI